MAGELVAGSVSAVALASLEATDGVTTKKALVVRAQLHDGQELLLRWHLDASDCQSASDFFREYADTLDQVEDSELRGMLEGDGS